MSWKQFSGNPEMQEGAFRDWIKLLMNSTSVQSLVARYNGRVIAGVQLTPSAIVSIAHNCGTGGAEQFLASGGKIVPKGDPLKFLRVGGYNLYSINNVKK